MKIKSSKWVKRIASCAAAILMAAAMIPAALTASAQEFTVQNGTVDFAQAGAGSKGSITVQGNEGQSLNGHRFNVYKLFDAENATGGESINYTWNPAYQKALQTVVGKNLQKDWSQVTEYEVIDFIQTLNNNKAEGANHEQKNEGRYSDFRYFVEALRDEIVAEGVSGDTVTVQSSAADNSFKITGLAYGYYLVDEITVIDGTVTDGTPGGAASLCMVNTANPDVEIDIKSDYPTVTKKIQEDDDKDAIGNDGYNDIGDYEIGQTVPYKFTSNIPNINGYKSYYYAWHDIMDEELTFNPSSVKITISNGSKSYVMKETEYTVNTETGTEETFTIIVTDIKAIVDREFNNKNELQENIYGQTVTVTYTATLNDKAAKDLGRDGYENDVRLEFSNNPDAHGEGDTGFTPWDTVVAFSFGGNVLKTNEHQKTLAGAKFRLYYDEACTKEVYVKKTTPAEGEPGYGMPSYIVINRDSVSGETAPKEAVEMETDENGKIMILGLDSDTYWLKETKAPAGYRKLLDPIKIVVEATYTDNRNGYTAGDGAKSDDHAALKDLSGKAHIEKFYDGVLQPEDLELEADEGTGTLNLNVVNKTGSKLPATGSVMTVVLLAGGAGLLAFALFSGRKHKAKTEEK